MSSIHPIVIYHQTFISALFISGFTIGSFLFSMKSVIIKTLKEDVYDNDEYQDKICQKIALGSKEGFYDSLQRFSDLLLKAIVFSFISAMFQITLGYVQHPVTSIICFLIAGFSWIYLARAIYHVQDNWRKSIEYSESMAKEKLAKKINDYKV
ncbi:MAG: hypothetical protein ACI83B_003008 [Sediminicola sp.]